MKWFLLTQVVLKQFLHVLKASDTGKQAAFALLDDIFQKNSTVDKQFIREVKVVIMLDKRFIKLLLAAAAQENAAETLQFMHEMVTHLEELLQVNEKGEAVLQPLFPEMDLKQDEWYDAFATSTAKARKHKRSMGDHLKMAGVARADNLNCSRTGLAATPKRCGIVQCAVQGFYKVAVKYYPLGAGDMHADKSGGIDKEDIKEVDDNMVD